METVDLEILADNADIEIIDGELHNKKAFAIKGSGGRAVVLDRKRIDGDREYKTILAEELGHVFCNALYPLSPKFALQARKAERRASCWAINKLLPYTQLKTASRVYTSAYELAEFFDVPQELIIKAVEYYRQKGRAI